jgi:hypothetical protein
MAVKGTGFVFRINMRIYGDNTEIWVRGTGFVLELICVYGVIILKWWLHVLFFFFRNNMRI